MKAREGTRYTFSQGSLLAYLLEYGSSSSCMHSFFFSGNSYSCKVKQARKAIGSFNVYKEVEAKVVYLLTC